MATSRILWAVSLSAVVGLCPSCESLPGSSRSQGAVIGGVAGATAGALIAKNNRLLGALIGAAAGAGGGYLIGAAIDNADGDDDKRKAEEAAREAVEDPATPEQAKNAATADINEDGFVTLDEVAALEKAGLTDDEMVERLRLTGQVFELTEEQEEYLVQRGVSRWVIAEMESLNEESKDQLLTRRKGSEVIGRDPEA